MVLKFIFTLNINLYFRGGGWQPPLHVDYARILSARFSYFNINSFRLDFDVARKFQLKYFFYHHPLATLMYTYTYNRCK